MTAFRILDQAPVFFDLKGQLCIGGILHFYDAGTATDKDVYGDVALTVNNGPVIAIGTDGRAVDDIWGSGNYRCRLYASDGTLVWDRDNIEIPGGDSTAIPALLSGQFLTNDGSVLQWSNIIQVPDPTGKANNLLSTDGTNIIWIPPPTVTPPYVISGNSIKFGTILEQFGTGVINQPSAGAHTAAASWSFPTPFTGTPVVTVGINTSSITSVGGNAVPALQSVTLTGATVQIDINDFSNVSGGINAAVNFSWRAIGPVAA